MELVIPLLGLCQFFKPFATLNTYAYGRVVSFKVGRQASI